VRKDIYKIHNQVLTEQAIIDQQKLAKIRQDDLATLRAQTDAMMRQNSIPAFTLTASNQASDRFVASITEQTAALEHQVATFGMSSDAIARYDLAQLDSSDAAQKQIANFKALQDQLAALATVQKASEDHAKAMANAWKQFGEVADRSLNDLIFSGKKFTDVLADITKQLGEMFLKWALFGPGGSGGLFGSLFSNLFGGLFGGGLNPLDAVGALPLGNAPGSALGFASGGSVSAGVPIMVGEQGPEMFVPATAGAVIPHGTSMGPQVNIVYNIDARGSSITEEQFRRSLMESERRAVQRSLNMVREVQARTG
jgi:hypothetical protein